LVANLNDRAVLSPLASALDGRRIELVVAGPGAATCHQLYFSPSEARYVGELMAEYLELGLPCDRDWLDAFRPVVPRLPDLFKHLNPALTICDRKVVIALQGSYENHLRAVRAAILRTTGL
jgi:hypothetical protein